MPRDGGGHCKVMGINNTVTAARDFCALPTQNTRLQVNMLIDCLMLEWNSHKLKV